jgi:hypothetical protein
VLTIKLIATPCCHLCFNIVDDITIHERVIVCKVCYLDLTKVALCQWSMLWYDSFVVQCLLIKLWFVLMDFIYLSQEHQLERHIGYKCLWWFLDLIEIAFLDGILILHIIVPSYFAFGFHSKIKIVVTWTYQSLRASFWYFIFTLQTIVKVPQNKCDIQPCPWSHHFMGL